MTPGDALLLLAAPQAAGGYLSPGSVYNSNGRWCSTTQVNGDVAANSLFPDLTGAQNAAQQVDYQCVFILNSDPGLTMTDVTVWIPASSIQSAGSVNWYVGADSTLPVAHDETTAPQAGYITSPTAGPPPTVTAWYAPVDQLPGGASLSDIPPGHVAAFWVKREGTGYVNPQGQPVTAGFDVQVTFDVTS